MWVPRRLGKRGKGELASIDLKLLLINSDRNQWNGGYFEFNEQRASTSTQNSKHELENVSSTEESDVVRPTATFSIVYWKNFDVAEKMILYIQVNHVIKKRQIKDAKGDEKLKKAELNCEIDLKDSDSQNSG